jgi:hypothetical protein
MSAKSDHEKRSGAEWSAHALPTRSEEALTILVRMSTIWRRSTTVGRAPR